MFNESIVERAERNSYFREVLATGPHAQIVVMSIAVGSEIGMETHPKLDQVLVFVSGEGEAILNGEHQPVGPGRIVMVPSGTEHNFINTGNEELKLYTVYAPPQHAPGTIHRTKADAEKAEAAEHAAEHAAGTVGGRAG
jgi:mannose-6-phosphate isomerase-like protein (cupin superfamily)